MIRMRTAALALFFLLPLGCAKTDTPADTETQAETDGQATGDDDERPVTDEKMTQPDDGENPDAVAERIRLRDVSVDQITAPFTRATVIKLNAIVRRSLDTIDAYDAQLDTMRAAIDEAAKGGATDEVIARAQAELTALAELKAQAAAAKGDMTDAVEALQASEENYNANILQGMIIFVNRVDEEINAEYEKQSARV